VGGGGVSLNVSSLRIKVRKRGGLGKKRLGERKKKEAPKSPDRIEGDTSVGVSRSESSSFSYGRRVKRPGSLRSEEEEAVNSQGGGWCTRGLFPVALYVYA